MNVVPLKRPKGYKSRAHVERMVRKVLDAQGADIAGFAFVVWAKDGASTADAQNKTSSIPNILIPDFVRNRLLAERIEAWAVSNTLRRLGFPDGSA